MGLHPAHLLRAKGLPGCSDLPQEFVGHNVDMLHHDFQAIQVSSLAREVMSAPTRLTLQSHGASSPNKRKLRFIQGLATTTSCLTYVSTSSSTLDGSTSTTLTRKKPPTSLPSLPIVGPSPHSRHRCCRMGNSIHDLFHPFISTLTSLTLRCHLGRDQAILWFTLQFQTSKTHSTSY